MDASSSASASRADASSPINSVERAARNRPSRMGSRMAASTRSRSCASGLLKTLACDNSTLPTPSASRAWRIWLPCEWVRTSTAMSPAAKGRPSSVTSPRCPAASRRAISPAQAWVAWRLAWCLAGRWPSAWGGSVHSCSAARASLRSASTGRGLSPALTGRYCRPSSMKARGLPPNRALNACSTCGVERWLCASVYSACAMRRACR